MSENALKLSEAIYGRRTSVTRRNKATFRPVQADRVRLRVEWPMCVRLTQTIFYKQRCSRLYGAQQRHTLVQYGRDTARRRSIKLEIEGGTRWNRNFYVVLWNLPLNPCTASLLSRLTESTLLWLVFRRTYARSSNSTVHRRLWSPIDVTELSL